VVSQAPQAGAPITVWVKRMDVTGAQYVAVKGVDTLETVDDFKACWVADEKLDVRPSLVTLRLVKCGAGKPTLTQETEAKVLDDPSLSLAEAKVTGTAWLLAFVAGVFAVARLFSPSAQLCFLRRYVRCNRVDATACSCFCGGFLEAPAQRHSRWQRVTSCRRHHVFGEQQAAWFNVHPRRLRGAVG
jgi:hypothetical protein